MRGVDAADIYHKNKQVMRHVHTFEGFLNEQEVLNEAMQISDNLKGVKTEDDLIKAVGSDFLIIHSKHRIGYESKRGGDWPEMFIIRGLNSSNIKVDEIGYSVFLNDLETIAVDGTGYSKKWSIEEIFTFFMFNKKRGNRIYTISELPIHKEAKKIYDQWYANQKEITSLLGSQVSNPGNRSVMTSGYAIMGEGQSHGQRYLEFDGGGKGRTYLWNVYSFDPQIRDGRSTARFGYSSYQKLYRIDKKIGDKILKIAEDQVELMKQAKSLLSNFYKEEKIQPK
jgi:hypothetical protein